MQTKPDFLSGVLFCALALGTTSHTHAGDVKLVSGTWDSVCRVEITWGPGAPNGTPVEVYSDVARNWSKTKPEKLCYRRASTPDNCDSGMTQWNTQWRCAANSGSGIEDLALE